jgi:hypothetical protein
MLKCNIRKCSKTVRYDWLNRVGRRRGEVGTKSPRISAEKFSKHKKCERSETIFVLNKKGNFCFYPPVPPHPHPIYIQIPHSRNMSQIQHIFLHIPTRHKEKNRDRFCSWYCLCFNTIALLPKLHLIHECRSASRLSFTFKTAILLQDWNSASRVKTKIPLLNCRSAAKLQFFVPFCC